MAVIDRVFKSYGVDFFGENAMKNITDAQIEEARCAAMSELGELTAKYGKQEKGTAAELFCNYLFEHYI